MTWFRPKPNPLPWTDPSRMDKKLIPLVAAFNALGLTTRSSCESHGTR